MREIVNGIFYVMRAGCPWRLLPNDLPPWGTIYRWFEGLTSNPQNGPQAVAPSSAYLVPLAPRKSLAVNNG
jgi:transposase